MTTLTPAPDLELRQAAIARLRKKRSLQAHTLAYVMVNLFLNMIWLAADAGSFYWPIFLLFGWGIGLAFHIWDVYAPAVPSEEKIEREARRLAHR
jgi:hypothetical protein